ncbi:hypothetical protein SBI_10023 [Streptomyces bingchenggensis BCW-1]|uniref:Uncharacterized protein n=1 Tax=Streptomyces bingchenggensis (strain BCW-1) TaxID=749414 RepID=D7CFC5_STRBB|nr:MULTISPECIES: hypothetical protein [Streptomyces]ADI13141.1 hypothetical protein SBI_10023 [Streptomyces bingchenggensis BCW-1]
MAAPSTENTQLSNLIGIMTPFNTEGMRAKLKRLVNRGILTEPEPGLFTLTPPTPTTPETDSS